jgi:LEA14-like dessication related protein
MRVPDTHRELTTRRLLLVGSFLLVSVATTAVFAQAMTGHLAAMHAPSMEVTVTDYEVTDDDALDVTLNVHNPTMKELDLEAARVNIYIDGEQMTDGVTSRFGDVTVEPDETKQVTISRGFREGGADRLRNADPEQVEIRGMLRVYVVNEKVDVPVDGMEGSA